MSEILWMLTRASGVVALVLIALALADGLIFSGREARFPRPAWWLDLHRGLGGYALTFTGFHILASIGSNQGVTWTQALVPNASKTMTSAFTLGVLSMYTMTIIVFTTWPKRVLPRRWWHLVHLLSIPAAVLAAVHAYQLGSDSRAPWYTVVCLVLVALTTYPLGLRLSGIVRRRGAAPRSATSPVKSPSMMSPSMTSSVPASPSVPPGVPHDRTPTY